MTEGNEKDVGDGDILPSSPDYGEDDTRRKTSVIEQCLAWGGEQRLRLLLTISVGGQIILLAPQRPALQSCEGHC